jgi:PTH2 family peptidyl-tRNA hydrolase
MSKESKDNEYRMYLIVNSDVKMGKGKVGAQVGHAVMYLTEMMISSKNYKDYKKSGAPKIVLKASQETMVELYKKYPNLSVCVHDAGRNQLEPNTFTVLGFLPMTDQLPELKKLSLL